MIRAFLATEQHFTELRNLWKVCFESDDKFLDTYFHHGIILTRTYILIDGTEIASALSIFPIEYQDHKGGYVYGVCTHPNHRSKGYAGKLMYFAEKEYIDTTGADFFITRPASAQLFEYYKKSGYRFPIRRSIDIIPLQETFIPSDFEYAAPEEIYDKRMEYPDGNYFKWNIEEIGYIMKYVRYCGGESIISDNKYLIGYPDKKRYYVLESNMQTAEMCYIIKSLHNDCSSVETYSSPTQNNNHPYILFKSMSFRPTGNPIFNFTME